MKFRVRIEVPHEVEADSEEEARYQAIDDLAFGRVSVAEAEVTDVQEDKPAPPPAPGDWERPYNSQGHPYL